MDQIFISYSRRDSQVVDDLVRELEARGNEVWVDREDIRVGDPWRVRISRAIRECRAFLLLLSPNSVKSEHVETELSLANRHRRPIIPLLYQIPLGKGGPVLPHGFALYLSNLNVIDLSALSREQALQQIGRALERPPSSRTLWGIDANSVREWWPAGQRGPRSERPPASLSGGENRRRAVGLAVVLGSLLVGFLACLCAFSFLLA